MYQAVGKHTHTKHLKHMHTITAFSFGNHKKINKKNHTRLEILRNPKHSRCFK